MNFNSGVIALSKIKPDCLVIPLFEGKPSDNPHLKDLPRKAVSQIEALFKNRVVAGKADEKYILKAEGVPGLPFILLVGLGKIGQYTRDTLREMGGNIASGLRGRKFKAVAIVVPKSLKLKHDLAVISQMLVEGINLGVYTLIKYKSKPVKKSFPNKFTFVIPTSWNQKDFDRGIQVGDIMAWGQNLSRDLIGHPSNYLTPQELAKIARSLARKYKFNCTVLNKDQIKRLKMNCLLGVNAGSTRPPRFIIMKYKGPRSGSKPICLVGKGITFDSGGISLKPSLDMDQMKGDMGGAACVIASVAVAARLKLPLNLIGLVPTTENLPSGSAYKPGDVLTALNGKTIEIINTDAEGRLILADALSYAQKFKPAAIIDIATLTGAAIIALGYISAGLFTNDKKLRRILNTASDCSNEKVWEMPLWEEYQEMIKSSIADIRNASGRPGSFCTSAAFLNNFTGKYPWAHIDMAAMDIEFKGGAYRPKGSSGYGVRLISEFLRNWK